ncbi:putative toxin-antitoxin system toxin component, PIN family [Candidatus Palauibacter sp.]|uniref:putative toxin-antitoxin system toxin component, PIN family n=1 Tax=Candidatus Palauibacter sp. TaxID=3101350 RepID=UPI003AF24E05
MRIFLDTNVLVSALATRGLCSDVLRVVIANHSLIAGETVLQELRRVLDKKFRVPRATIEAADEFLREAAVVVTAAAPLSIELVDPDDVPILGEAVAGKADVLVTGDRDLLRVAGEAPVAIVSPRGFWDTVRSES